VPQNKDLQLPRPTRPGQQHYERKQVSDGQIRERPQQELTSHSTGENSADATGASRIPNEDRA
jgi:hypothetical protein